MITRGEILKGREAVYPLNQELERNLADLLVKLNFVRKLRNQPMIVTSGYRPGLYNTQAGGAKGSYHLTCQAADFYDKDGSLGAWCREHKEEIKGIGLYMEHLDYTPGWVHLQSVKPKSGNWEFIP